MKITWLGTASVRIEAAGERILFDPFVQLIGGENPNCGEDFGEDEDIFITHGHLDHLMEIPAFLEEDSVSQATVYCGSVAAGTLSGMAEDTSNVVEVRPGTRIRIGEVTVCGAGAAPDFEGAVFLDQASLLEKHPCAALAASPFPGKKADLSVRGAGGRKARAGDGKYGAAGGDLLSKRGRSSDPALPGERPSGGGRPAHHRKAGAQTRPAGSF